MSLYDFTDLGIGTSIVKLASESIIFNGINIDKELAGYRTLNVAGRENFSRDLSTSTTKSDGELFMSSKLNSNEITIKYQLIADTISEFNRRYTQLKYWLQGNEQPFYFRDENEFVRYGTVTSLEVDSLGTIHTTGTITIKMTNPFRYGQTKIANGKTRILINDPQIIYRQPLDTIEITNQSAVQKIVINIDNKYNLTINGSYKENANIIIDFNNLDITQNGNSILSNIDITKTNIFEALVENGNQINCAQASSITVTYRIKIL